MSSSVVPVKVNGDWLMVADRQIWELWDTFRFSVCNNIINVGLDLYCVLNRSLD